MTDDGALLMSMRPAGTAAAATAEQLDPRRWLALGVVLIAVFMQLMDISIVNVAIPSIQRDLDASYSQVQWVLAGYQLAFAVVLITGGRLGDIYGRKRLFLIGVSGFTVASALCGFAQSPVMLVGSRIFQGAMGALMFPQALSVTQVEFPQRERGAAFGITGAVIGLATISGPLLGGRRIIRKIFGLDWRPIYLVNLPLGVLAVVAAVVLLRESRAEGALRLDPGGVAIVSAALLMLIYPLVEGRDLGWPVWTFVLMAASVPVFALFVLYERRKTRKDNSPLVVLGLFGERAFVSGLLLNLVFFSGVAAFFLTFSLFLQIGLGFTALHSGLTTIPFSFGTAIGSAVSVRLAPRLGRAILGLGCTIPPLLNVILAGISGRNAGSASGVLSTTQQVGGALGVAIIGVIFFGLLASQAKPTIAAVVPRLRSQLQAAHLPAPVADQVIAGFSTCFHDRASAKDPSATPPSCRQATSPVQAQGQGGQAISQVLQSAGVDARKRDFVASIKGTLWYEVAVYGLSFLVVFLLPNVGGHHLRQAGGAAA